MRHGGSIVRAPGGARPASSGAYRNSQARQPLRAVAAAAYTTTMVARDRGLALQHEPRRFGRTQAVVCRQARSSSHGQPPARGGGRGGADRESGSVLIAITRRGQPAAASRFAAPIAASWGAPVAVQCCSSESCRAWSVAWGLGPADVCEATHTKATSVAAKGSPARRRAAPLPRHLRRKRRFGVRPVSTAVGAGAGAGAGAEQPGSTEYEYQPGGSAYNETNACDGLLDALLSLLALDCQPPIRPSSCIPRAVCCFFLLSRPSRVRPQCREVAGWSARRSPDFPPATSSSQSQPRRATACPLPVASAHADRGAARPLALYTVLLPSASLVLSVSLLARPCKPFATLATRLHKGRRIGQGWHAGGCRPTLCSCAAAPLPPRRKLPPRRSTSAASSAGTLALGERNRPYTLAAAQGPAVSSSSPQSTRAPPPPVCLVVRLAARQPGRPCTLASLELLQPSCPAIRHATAVHL
jgi:hypothetical protein